MGWGTGLVPTVSLDHDTCEQLFFLQGTCQSEAQVTLLILSNLLPKKVPAKSLQPQSLHHSPWKRQGWRNGWARKKSLGLSQAPQQEWEAPITPECPGSHFGRDRG